MVVAFLVGGVQELELLLGKVIGLPVLHGGKHLILFFFGSLRKC